MFCAIAGTVPEEPVFTNDGYIFERRVVEKHVQNTGKHPITGEELTLDDLIHVKLNKAVKPRPAPAASIPGLLGIFHNEWDTLMLETHQLRQALNASRQELAHALYQHDSASRVVARLLRERDEARKALESAVAAAVVESANGKRQVDAGEAGPAKRARTEEVPGGFQPELVAKLEESSKRLSKGRKKRVVSSSLATPEAIADFALLASQPLHKTSKGGILAIDTSPENDTVVATAGVDGQVHVFDRQAGRILAELQGHSKKVNDVKFMGQQGRLVTAGADKTACIWQADAEGTYTAAAVLKDHTAEVTAVTVHPLADFFVTASLDKTWSFYDVNVPAAPLAQVADASLKGGYASAEFHPDGVLLGTGTQEGLVRVWDLKTQKNVAKFEGHSGSICGMSFSENGYYLATCAADGVKLWDLRKLKNFKTITPYGEGSGASSVSFDTSGLFLAVGGADARVYGAKQDWDVVKTFPDQPKKGVYSVKWGSDAKTLFVGTADHNLRIYGTQSA